MPPLDRRRASSEFCLALERDDVIAEAGIGPKCSDGQVRTTYKSYRVERKYKVRVTDGQSFARRGPCVGNTVALKSETRR